MCVCDGYTPRIGFLVTSVVSNEQDIIIVRRWVITTRRSSSLVVARWSITKRLDIWFWISTIFQVFPGVVNARSKWRCTNERSEKSSDFLLLFFFANGRSFRSLLQYVVYLYFAFYRFKLLRFHGCIIRCVKIFRRKRQRISPPLLPCTSARWTRSRLSRANCFS